MGGLQPHKSSYFQSERMNRNCHDESECQIEGNETITVPSKLI